MLNKLYYLKFISWFDTFLYIFIFILFISAHSLGFLIFVLLFVSKLWTSFIVILDASCFILNEISWICCNLDRYCLMKSYMSHICLQSHYSCTWRGKSIWLQPFIYLFYLFFYLWYLVIYLFILLWWVIVLSSFLEITHKATKFILWL